MMGKIIQNNSWLAFLLGKRELWPVGSLWLTQGVRLAGAKGAVPVSLGWGSAEVGAHFQRVSSEFFFLKSVYVHS